MAFLLNGHLYIQNLLAAINGESVDDAVQVAVSSMGTARAKGSYWHLSGVCVNLTRIECPVG